MSPHGVDSLTLRDGMTRELDGGHLPLSPGQHAQGTRIVRGSRVKTLRGHGSVAPVEAVMLTTSKELTRELLEEGNWNL